VTYSASSQPVVMFAMDSSCCGTPENCPIDYSDCLYKGQSPVAAPIAKASIGSLVDELRIDAEALGLSVEVVPVAKQVVMPEREWLQSDGLIYSLENDVNYYEINVTQVEGNRHDGKRAEFASKLIELLNAAD
jgi:hypothetical protein